MPSESRCAEIAVQMVDPNDGRQLQAWSFSGIDAVTIGRGEDQSVVLADPYVSRKHAELRLTPMGTWQLIAHGRSGVYVNGSSVTQLDLAADTIFRLGPVGPAFRYSTNTAHAGAATLSFDPASMLVLQMDRKQLDAETRDVIETDYFQRLQETARTLRRQRTAAGSPQPQSRDS